MAETEGLLRGSHSSPRRAFGVYLAAGLILLVLFELWFDLFSRGALSSFPITPNRPGAVFPLLGNCTKADTCYNPGSLHSSLVSHVAVVYPTSERCAGVFSCSVALCKGLVSGGFNGFVGLSGNGSVGSCGADFNWSLYFTVVQWPALHDPAVLCCALAQLVTWVSAWMMRSRSASRTAVWVTFVIGQCLGLLALWLGIASMILDRANPENSWDFPVYLIGLASLKALVISFLIGFATQLVRAELAEL